MDSLFVMFTLPQVRVTVVDEADAAAKAWEQVKGKTLNDLFGEHKESIRVSLVKEARLVGGSDETTDVDSGSGD